MQIITPTHKHTDQAEIKVLAEELFSLSPGAFCGSVIGCLDRKAVDVHGEASEVAVNPGSEKTGISAVVFVSSVMIDQRMMWRGYLATRWLRLR